MDDTRSWHLCERVPQDAFVPAGENSFVASPELCFQQLALSLDFIDLVLLGMEFCGTYCLDPDEEEGFGKRRQPLTSTGCIAAFLAENEGARGRRAAQTALRYVIDGAASPMEAAIALLITLPYKRGGYHLPRPILNKRIDLDESAMRLVRKAYCRGDICWSKPNLDLEYLGLSSHEGDTNMLADRARTLAIEEMGYEVIEITKDQALDMVAFDIVAKRIASKLGKRLDKAKCGSTAERRELFERLYRWERPADAPPSADTGDPLDEGVVYGRRA